MARNCQWMEQTLSLKYYIIFKRVITVIITAVL